MSTRAPKTRAGLTLVELLAALAVATIVTVAAMNVTARLAHSAAAEQARHEQQSIDVPLRELLTAELTQAYEVQLVETGFTVRTPSTVDSGSMRRQQLPGRVTLAVQKIGDRNWLVRTQQPSTAGEPSMELVCSNVASVNVRSAVPYSFKKALPETKPLWMVLPPAVIATVTFDDNRPEMTFVVRREK